jgi:hypothetical protein
MLLQRVNRKEPEKIFIEIQNVEGATATTGMPVAYALGASMDGVQATIANAAGDYPQFMGVVVADIANNDYGLVQIAGYCNSILLSNAGTSITVTAGDCLIPAPAGFYSAAAPTYANAGMRHLVLRDTIAVSAASYVRGLIRMI